MNNYKSDLLCYFAIFLSLSQKTNKQASKQQKKPRGSCFSLCFAVHVPFTKFYHRIKNTVNNPKCGRSGHRHAVAKKCWCPTGLSIGASCFFVLHLLSHVAADGGGWLWNEPKSPQALTCCRQHRWDPAGRRGMSHEGACVASLLWSWWVSPPGPQ